MLLKIQELFGLFCASLMQVSQATFSSSVWDSVAARGEESSSWQERPVPYCATGGWCSAKQSYGRYSPNPNVVLKLFSSLSHGASGFSAFERATESRMKGNN